MVRFMVRVSVMVRVILFFRVKHQTMHHFFEDFFVCSDVFVKP